MSSTPTHRYRPPPPVSLARTVPADRRPVTVSTEHNTWSSHHPVTRWANRLTGRLDAATFAVTEEVRASMSGPAAARAEVLVHGIDVAAVAARPAAVRTAIRARLGIGPDEFAIGTVANFRPQKDYPNLLAAARLLVDRGEQYRIVAVGQGPLEADITRRRDELGLRDHVELLGFRPDAVDVMAACDAFTLASAWEGLPVAVMEALALGLPIVATAVGGVAEHLDATCAVLVPPGDPAALADGLAARDRTSGQTRPARLGRPCRRRPLRRRPRGGTSDDLLRRGLRSHAACSTHRATARPAGSSGIRDPADGRRRPALGARPPGQVPRMG